MNSNKRHQLHMQIGDAKHILQYKSNLSEEEKISLQMKIDSAERQLAMDSNGANIFEQDYGITQKGTGKEDIFNQEKNEVSEEAKAWLFSGYDFNVPKPTKEYPHLTYYCQFQNGKKR